MTYEVHLPVGDDLPCVLMNGTPCGTVTIIGSGGTATANLAAPGQPPQDNLWHNYALPLSPTLWVGNLAGALSNVSEISVDLESHNGISEIIGFDNFKVQAINSVPEPGAYTLLTGMVLYGGSILLGHRRK